MNRPAMNPMDNDKAQVLGVNWTINITEACRKRGIDNAYQLWQKIGGSKQTTAQLFDGSSTMIKLTTMNKIQSIVGINPFEYFINEGTIR